MVNKPTTDEQSQTSEDSPVVSAARVLGKLRWKGVSSAERREFMHSRAIAKSVKVRKSQPKATRTARASANAKAITPEAAKARALKAWETKRRKAELRDAG